MVARILALLGLLLMTRGSSSPRTELALLFSPIFPLSPDCQWPNFLLMALVPLSRYSVLVTRQLAKSGDLANASAEWYTSVVGLTNHPC